MKVYVFDPTKLPPPRPCVGCGEPSMRGYQGNAPPRCRTCWLLLCRHRRRRDYARNGARLRSRREAEAQP